MKTHDSNEERDRAEDLQAAGELTVEGLQGIVSIVESLHSTIYRTGGLRTGADGTTKGLTGLIYRIIRRAMRFSGKGLQHGLSLLEKHLGRYPLTKNKQTVLAALNGILGHHLEAQGNALAIPMTMRHAGEPIHALPTREKPTYLLMIHGLCMSDQDWTQQGKNRAEQLAVDMDATPLYLRYNTGLHISQNGEKLDQLMESLLGETSQSELIILAHSMGGLVMRSALAQASEQGHHWPEAITKMFFLGTPHHGAILERAGNIVDRLLESTPYSAPFAKLGKIRSHGITDLRYGYLSREDWQGRDPFKAPKQLPVLVPLPEHIHCFAIAASSGNRNSTAHDRVVGDGLVTVQSALGIHKDYRRTLDFPKSHTEVIDGINHMELLYDQTVYEALREWM